MKKLITLIFIIFISFQGFTQDPELFRTWYLYHVSMDLDEPYYISDISPSIQPFITIEEDLSYIGEGACNSFSGSYEYLGGNSLDYLSFNSSNDDCGNQSHNFFENDYFGFIPGGFEYTITQENNELTLHFDSPVFSGLIFRDFPLAITDNNISEIKIYPNPTSELLFISSEGVNDLNAIKIYTLLGKVITSQKYIQNTPLDISNLSEGIYFIELISEEVSTIKRFIKK